MDLKNGNTDQQAPFFTHTYLLPGASSKAENLSRSTTRHIVKTQGGNRVAGLVHEKCRASVVRLSVLANTLAHLFHQIRDDFRCFWHGRESLLGHLHILAVGGNNATPRDDVLAEILREARNLCNLPEKLVHLLLLVGVNVQAPVQGGTKTFREKN